MESDKKYQATVFGSTGLVGQKLVEQLKNDGAYLKVYLPNRRTVNFEGDRLENRIIDFDSLEQHQDIFKVDHIFIALGTTIKKAGSKAQFQKIDLSYPIEIAKFAKKFNASCTIMISSIGASPDASNFYLKTKGEAEKQLQAILNDKVYFVRPSMLLGKRKEFRFGEEVGKLLLKLISPLMVGGLRKYRGIYDREVAAAMIQIAKKEPQKQLFISDELKQMNA